MINPKQELPEILDEAGWGIGIRAILKQAFGTDTELRMRGGGVHEEVAHARKEVGRMSEEAEGLLSALERKNSIDKVEHALADIIKDV